MDHQRHSAIWIDTLARGWRPRACHLLPDELHILRKRQTRLMDTAIHVLNTTNKAAIYELRLVIWQFLPKAGPNRAKYDCTLR